MARASIRGSRSGITPWRIASARKRVQAISSAARLVAAFDASLLLALGGALAAQENLLGDEDAVAQDLSLGQLEAVGAHRAQRVAGIGMVRGDRVEPLVQLAQRLVEDHVQAVLLGVEVVIERGGSDADVVGDVRPLRVLVPVAAEPVDGRVENLGSPDAFVAGPASRPRTPTRWRPDSNSRQVARYHAPDRDDNANSA